MLGAVLMALVPLLAVAGVAWAVGSMSNRPGMASTGKMAVLVILVAAFIVGGAGALVTWASGLGDQI